MFRGTRWSLGASACSQATRLINSLVLARVFLAPEDFGIWAMALTVTGFLSPLRHLGTGPAIVQKKAVSPGLLDSVFWLNLSVGILLGLGVFSGAGPVADLFREPRLAPVLQLASLGFVVTSMGSVPRAILQRRMAFDRLACGEITSLVVLVALSQGMAMCGYGFWALVVSSLAKEAVVTVVTWGLAAWRPGLRFFLSEIRSIWSFGANLTLFTLINYLFTNLDRFLVGRFLGAESLGYYSLANRVLGVSVRLVVPQFFAVLFPALSRLTNDHARIRSGFLRALSGIALVIFPVVAGTGVIGDSFAQGVLGPKWAMVGALLPILSVRYLMEAMMQGGQFLYRVKGRTDLLMYWGLASGAIYVLSYFIGLNWGLKGVAVARSVSACLLMVPGLTIPMRLIQMGFSKPARELLPYAGTTLVMVLSVAAFLGLARRLGLPEMTVLISGIAVGGIVYAGVTFSLKLPALRDLKSVLSPR